MDVKARSLPSGAFSTRFEPQLRFCLDASLITDDALASRQDRMRWKRKHQLRLLLAVVILRCWLMLMRKDAQPRASHIEMPSSALGGSGSPSLIDPS